MAARLRPSAATRWVNCPPSVDRAAKYADVSGDEAKRGDVAHALGQHCLSNGECSCDAYLGADTSELPGLEDDDYRRFEIDQDMVDGVNDYLDHVLARCHEGVEYELYCELKLGASHIDSENKRHSRRGGVLARRTSRFC